VAKLNWFPFYPRDWYADAKLTAVSNAIRGMWIDLLAVMFIEQSAEICGTIERIARLCRSSTDDVTLFVREAQAAGFCEVEVSGEIIKIRSRRFEREFAKRQNTRERVRHYRERNRNVTLPLQSMIATETETEADTETDRINDVSSSCLEKRQNSGSRSPRDWIPNDREGRWPNALAWLPGFLRAPENRLSDRPGYWDAVVPTLLDVRWWTDMQIEMGGVEISEALLRRLWAQIRNRLRDQPRQTPTVRGCRRWIGKWLLTEARILQRDAIRGGRDASGFARRSENSVDIAKRLLDEARRNNPGAAAK
jgi:hypothetical protein